MMMAAGNDEKKTTTKADETRERCEPEERERERNRIKPAKENERNN